MDKPKHGKPNWNHVLQWVIIGLIISIVVSHFNLWAFWWIPFLFFITRGCRCGWHSCSSHDEKRKYIDDDDDVHYV